jgi:HK97 gp10 family phage protein
MATLVHVKGLEELKAKFAQLPKDMNAKVLRSGVAAGARVVKTAAIANAPIGDSRRGHVAGTLKRAAIIKFLPAASNDTQVEYIVTFRMGKRQQRFHRDAYYASWVEFGHKIVPRSAKALNLKGLLRNKRTLASRREAARRAGNRVPPHRFLGPAWEATKDAALQAITEATSRALDRALK